MHLNATESLDGLLDALEGSLIMAKGFRPETNIHQKVCLVKVLRSQISMLSRDNSATIIRMPEMKNRSVRQRILTRHPSAFLLVAQLLSLVLFAVFDGTESGRVLLSAFGVLLLVLLVWVVKRSPGINWIAWGLAILAALLSLLSWRPIVPDQLVWGALLEAALYFYATGSLIAYMLGDDIVTTDELFAAGATFTLIAWGFAYLYLVCQAWFPGSFNGAVNPQQARTFMELLFLSFTNLSATGLSDIVPVTAPARVLVMLEQFAGIAYLAMVVSRLVSLSMLHRDRKRGDTDAPS